VPGAPRPIPAITGALPAIGGLLVNGTVVAT